MKVLTIATVVIFLCCCAYQIIYMFIPFFIKDKKHKDTKFCKYAVLISARNEELVIGQLIDSIKNQDYDSNLITTFVVADNCTDNTAAVAREHGAYVFERFDLSNIGKGYALDYLTAHIYKKYGEDAFDGFFVFDSDNILEKNYISEMNKTFSDGYNIVTGYRNSKNYGDNWISAGCSLWFLRESKYINYSRMLLRTSSGVSGTGFLFSAEVLKRTGGWKFYLITEDNEFTISNVLNGEIIGYCNDAILYDEQPVKFGQSWHQRIRWARGYIDVFKKYGFRLIRGMFRGSFSCYDMVMAFVPSIIMAIIGFIAAIYQFTFCIFTHGNMWKIGETLLVGLVCSYLALLFLGAMTTFTERKRIHTTRLKKIWYVFTFPIFVATFIPTSIVALFTKPEWKHIEHNRAVTLNDICDDEE